MKNKQVTKSFIMLQALLLLMLAQFGTDIYLPSIPVIIEDLATTEFMVKLSLSVMIVGLGFSQLVYGTLSDYYGRRAITLMSLAIFLLGSAITIIASSIGILIIGRIIQGLGVGFCAVLSSIVAKDIYTGYKVNQALGLVGVVYAVSPVAAPVIGGVLQTYIHWSASFWLLAILGIFMFVLIGYCFPETNKTISSNNGIFKMVMRLYRTALSDRVFMSNLSIVTLFYAGEVAYIIQMPLIVQNIFGVSPLMTGWLVIFTSIAIVIGSILSSWLVAYITPNRIIGLGVLSAILGIILLLLFVSTESYNLITFIGPIVLYMFGAGIAFPNCIANCLERLPDSVGTASALAVGLLTGVGGMLTFIVAKLSYTNAFALPLFMLILVIGMLPTYYVAIKTR